MTSTSNNPSLPVLLLAGRRPGVDPIATHFGTEYKVLAPVAGKPMIMHTLNSLQSMTNISNIIILTQEPDELKSKLSTYSISDRVIFMKSESGIANSILKAWKGDNVSEPFLVTTADNCLIRQEHIDDFLEQSARSSSDLMLGMVEKNQLLNRYPESRRTWLNFKDISVTGCNLFLIRNESAASLLNYWKAFESSPKKVFKLAWSIGPLVFFKYLIKNLSLSESFGSISEKSGTNVKPVVINEPNIAIDADKLSDIVQIESILISQKQAAKNTIQDIEQLPLVIFDLDRTITTHGTYLPFLIFYAVRTNPLRLIVLPVVTFMMLIYVLKIISRKKLKIVMHAMLMGSPDKDRLREICDLYVNRVLGKKVNLDALLTIRRWKSTGSRLVIATASFDWMARSFARRLGVDDIIASVSIEKENKVVPGINGENCYGKDKLAIVESKLGSLKVLKDSGKATWFYTDHHSDIPMLELCSQPVVVNPSSKLKHWAMQHASAKILCWNDKSVSSPEIYTSAENGL